MLNTTFVTQNITNEQSTVVIYDSFTVTNVSNNESQFDSHNFMDTRSTVKDRINYYNDIKTYIHTFVPPVLITIGVICNLLSFVVWVRGLLNKRGSSSSYFFACLAIADVITLFSVSLYDHIENAYFIFQQSHSVYVDIKSYSTLLCKLYSFMFPFSLSLTSYILAFLALFRMIGVIYPLRYKQICSAKNAKIIILCIIAATVLLHFGVIFRAKLVNSTGDTRPVCSVPNNKGFIQLLVRIMVVMLDFCVPMLIIVLCNIGIISKLVKRRAPSYKTRAMSKGDHAFSRNIIVLVAVSLVYIVTMSPMCVGILVEFYTDWRTAPGIELAKYKLGWAIVFNICLLNSSTNFFTYCLAHPQFVPEVKLFFASLAAKIGSILSKCKKRNAVGIIHVQEVKAGTACTSGITTLYGTASTSGILPMDAIPSISGIKPKGSTCTYDEIDKISYESL